MGICPVLFPIPEIHSLFIKPGILQLTICLIIRMKNPNKPDDLSLMATSTPPSFLSRRSWNIQQLPELGVELDVIKDVFSCSPLQDGVLMSAPLPTQYIGSGNACHTTGKR